MDTNAIHNALTASLPHLGEPEGQIADLKRLSGGASQETWRFDVIDVQGQPRPLILRRCPITGPRNGEALPLSTEAFLLEQARNAQVCVPEVVHVCRETDGLGDAFIMSFVEGETLARKILRDEAYAKARQVLAADCGTQLARIHAIPVDAAMTDRLRQSDGLDQLARYEDIYRGFNADRPIIELAFKWLRKTAPAPIASSLVHGDFRHGNLIVGADGLRAVLDWELAHVGDPREDIGWICVNSWRFGQARSQVGGFGDLPDLLSSYRKAGGATFGLADIKWFQALGSLKWGIMCLIMYQAFKGGADRSIERAMIGRRTSEAEMDLLNLIEGREHA